MMLPVSLPVRPLVAALGLMLSAALCAAPTPKVNEFAHEIQDPYYGNTLFEYYQDHDFTTLTELMASQYFGRVAHHADEAEVLRGGILLSYGLHREAGEVFEHLIDKGVAPGIRDRAWFYLAKIRYQRGYLEQAEAAVNRIGNALPQELQEPRLLLQANLLMAKNDYTGAVKLLDVPQGSATSATPSDYITYNLGIALIKSGNQQRGLQLLDQLGQAPQADEEHRALRDRANLALGFFTLSAGKATNLPTNDPARKQPGIYFERIRLNSKESSKALLGMGWASVASKDYQQALIPWQELAQRDTNDTAELEARIAIPYAYAELGALGQSARLYNDAINSFNQEDVKLDESIAAIKAGQLTDALLADNPGHDMGWFWNIRALPSMPHASHLAHVLAQHEFQEAFKNYRDLQFLTNNLQQWHDKLGVFEDMLENRRKAFADRLPQVMQQASASGISTLKARQTVLLKKETEGEVAADGIAFADAKQLELLARSSSARQLIDQHPGEAEFTAAQQKVRLVHGALLWQLTQDLTQREWDTVKNLNEITEQLARARQLEAELQQAQHDEPARFDQLEQRIHAMADTINNMLPRVAALSRQQQQAVQDIAVAELSHEKGLLIQYSTQARFALAQLYDRGSGDFRQEDAHAQQP